MSQHAVFQKVPNAPGLYRNSATGVYLAIKCLGGKRRERSLKTTDRKLAERRMKEWVESFARINPELERITLRELLAKYLLIMRAKSRSTMRRAGYIAGCFTKTWKFGMDIEVRNIRPSMLDEWLALHEPRLKNSSYNLYVGFIRSVFEIAAKDKVVIESPAARIGTPWKRPQKTMRRVPTTEQFDAIIAHIRLNRFNEHHADSADFLEFLGTAGLGQAEAGNLEWSNVDWDMGRIHVRRQKTDALFYVPMYPKVRALLERMKASPKALASQRVFSIKDAKKALTGACHRLELPHFSQRNLRQYAIVLLLRAGIDPKLISRFQGHNDGGGLIMSTYSEVIASNDQEYERMQLSKLSAAA